MSDSSQQASEASREKKALQKKEHAASHPFRHSIHHERKKKPFSPSTMLALSSRELTSNYDPMGIVQPTPHPSSSRMLTESYDPISSLPSGLVW